jgi:hypothetical protein
VTVRDPFQRGLLGLEGTGVSGGDDVLTHTNNWAQTPVIASAVTSVTYTLVQVHGFASPYSLVDIFFDTANSVKHQGQVMADMNGVFDYSGLLPGPATQVLAGSTLDDSGYPNRLGSSSQLSSERALELGDVPVLTPRVWLPDIKR